VVTWVCWQKDALDFAVLYTRLEVHETWQFLRLEMNSRAPSSTAHQDSDAECGIADSREPKFCEQV
jgi:hypothetical protein